MSYKTDFEAERRSCEEACSETADLKTKLALMGERTQSRADKDNEIELLRSQLVEHQQTVEVIELVNKKLDQEVQSARKRCENLEQENRARSSQVKQYAKEVQRLKQEVLYNNIMHLRHHTINEIITVNISFILKLEMTRNSTATVAVGSPLKHLVEEDQRCLSDNAILSHDESNDGITKLSELYKLAQDDNEVLNLINALSNTAYIML